MSKFFNFLEGIFLLACLVVSAGFLFGLGFGLGFGLWR